MRTPSKMAAKSSSFYILSLLLLPLLLSSFPSNASSQTTTDREGQTLLQIKSEWGNPPALHSWNASASASGSPSPHCNWTGIQCSAAGSVTGISLPDQNLNEPIPAAVCDLKSLSVLDLYNNSLPGTFPTALYNCSALQKLELAQNLFVGAIPADVHRLSPGLTYLSLSNNNFTGDIPPSIGRLPAIETLLLDSNLFNGSFPAELGNLSTLQTLYLAYNPFRPASIPPEFGNLTALTYLYMANTHLLGGIPESFGNLSRLVHLDLSMNTLSGRIPSGIWMLESLQILYLYANRLTEEITGTIGALGLVSVDVSINRLTGHIPEGFGKLRNLQGLAMYYNQLSGEIPASIGLLPSLTNIRLFNNSLTGVIPSELGKHSKLWNFEVDDNYLSGELPQYLCAGKALTSVVAFDNNLTGTIPASLGSCPTLDNIQLHRNGLSGDIPAGIWSAVNLTTIIMHHNALSGALPNELPWNLSRLEIEQNRLTGSIPSVGTNLRVFTAGGNLFSGDLPTGLAGMPRLQQLSLGGNMISGSISAKIESLRFLTDLDLSNNRLTGEIPAEIGFLPVLTSLDLSNNQLSGEVPLTIGNLNLNSLNLSSNRLSGEIPASLQIRAYDRSFLSNPGICSTNPLDLVQICGSRSNSTYKLSTGLRVMFIILGAVFFLLAAVLGLLVARNCRLRRNDGNYNASWKLTSFHALDFTESGIVRGLSEQNLVGSGGSGMVYRVALGSLAVAVKKIWNSKKLDSKLEKEFQAEVQILGSIRHANIVKLLCCISGSNSKLLVYEYMGNGSLDQLLHKRRRGPMGGSLDWPTRLSIARGAARGLCYMHHGCSPPIIHRDVKSSNILLDAEFVPKIADFGLARMLAKTGEPESVSAIAGSFGYMAPECSYMSKVNEKMDVYSFGVVLLELVTGREANGEGDDGWLVGWAWQHFQEGESMVDAMDEEIRDPSYFEEMELVLNLGLACTGTLALTRPSMKEVLQVLVRCDLAAGNGCKIRGGCEVVPLLQAKKGSRRVRPSDAEKYGGEEGVAYDLEYSSSA